MSLLVESCDMFFLCTYLTSLSSVFCSQKSFLAFSSQIIWRFTKIPVSLQNNAIKVLA